MRLLISMKNQIIIRSEFIKDKIDEINKILIIIDLINILKIIKKLFSNLFLKNIIKIFKFYILM